MEGLFVKVTIQVFFYKHIKHLRKNVLKNLKEEHKSQNFIAIRYFHIPLIYSQQLSIV